MDDWLLRERASLLQNPTGVSSLVTSLLSSSFSYSCHVILCYNRDDKAFRCMIRNTLPGDGAEAQLWHGKELTSLKQLGAMLCGRSESES